jgi:NAD(P)-dependent dehydrogenase (short-subunit alcohol dehydrogenase family)
VTTDDQSNARTLGEAPRDAHATYDPSDDAPGAAFLHEHARGPGGADDDASDAYARDYRRRYAADYAAEAGATRTSHRRRGGGANALLLGGAAVATWLVARAFARQVRHFDFAGRVALVAGGSRGLGLELARQLVDAGARVAICARDEDALEAARTELAGRAERRGGAAADVFARGCDVTDPDDVGRLVEAVRGALGEVDVLINSAGIIQVGPSEQMTRADFDEAMRVNFYGPLHTVLALAPGMRARKTGRVVNISSIAGKVSAPHLLPYSASKFALTGLSEGLRQTLAKDGVYVTSVYPGELRTGSPAHAVFKGDAEAEYRWFTTTDSAPVTSMPAEAAARRILAACRGGDAELIMPASAWVQALFHALFPAITQDLNALLDRRLPGPGARRRAAPRRARGRRRAARVGAHGAARRRRPLQPGRGLRAVAGPPARVGWGGVARVTQSCDCGARASSRRCSGAVTMTVT